MIKAAFAAALAALFSISASSGTVEARGGLARGPGMSFGAVHTMHASWPSHSPGLPHIHGPRWPDHGERFAGDHDHRRFAFWHRGQRIDLELPFAYGGFYDPYYDVMADEALTAFDPTPTGDSHYQFTAVAGTDHWRGCHSQAQWVPGRNGPTRIVMTRC